MGLIVLYNGTRAYAPRHETQPTPQRRSPTYTTGKLSAIYRLRMGLYMYTSWPPRDATFFSQHLSREE